MAFVFISSPLLLFLTSDLSKQECMLVNHTTTRPISTNMTLRLQCKPAALSVDQVVTNNTTLFLF